MSRMVFAGLAVFCFIGIFFAPYPRAAFAGLVLSCVALALTVDADA